MADVVMPQLGETVTEGTITRWLKKVGEHVERDEPLFEVSTDKVDSEVPAPAGGTLVEIRVAEGDTVDVGAVLAVIADGADTPAAPAPPAPAPPAPAPPDASLAPQAGAHQVLGAEPSVARERAEPITRAGGMVLSPVVRRLIEENRLDASKIVGTGVGGRITRADVLNYIDATRVAGSAPVAGAAEPKPSTPPTPRSSAPAFSAAEGGSVRHDAHDEIVPFTNIRRRTAEHMVRSKATSAHTLVAKEADFEAVERVRQAVGERFRSEEGFSLTYLPFVARAVVDALRRWPHLNASVGDDALIVHHAVHLAIAVDLSFEGLVAPVVHDAAELTVRGLARRIADLAQRARSRQLTPDDVVGGTFTITNPGPFGTFMTVPIINQPQVAILSTDTVSRRPAVVRLPDGSEALGIRSIGMLALSFDHRAVDGAYASAFLADVAQVIADHDWASEL